jgi:hypothetical protein
MSKTLIVLCLVSMATASWMDCTWIDKRTGLWYNFTSPNGDRDFGFIQKEVMKVEIFIFFMHHICDGVVSV